MRLIATRTLRFEGGRVNWRPLHTGKARPSAGAINPALLVNMRRPTALFIIGGCAVALVPRATPARPRTRLQASLDSFLADRSAAKLFYDGVSDGALKSYAGDALPDNSLDDQKKISALVDYMHTELMKKSMMADYTDEAAPLGDEFDDFIEEGRKMLATSLPSHILPSSGRLPRNRGSTITISPKKASQHASYGTNDVKESEHPGECHRWICK